MTDEQLVILAQQGQADAVAALYEKYFPPLYRFCFWQTNRNTELAQDLTHDVFIEMSKSIRSFKKQGNFKNWLYTIAKRQILHWMKTKYDLPSTTLFDEIPEPELFIDPASQEKKATQLQNMLQKLTETEQQVIELRYLRNYSVKEVEKELNISAANVKVISHRALKKLRDMTV